jgi:hypothetical protein
MRTKSKAGIVSAGKRLERGDKRDADGKIIGDMDVMIISKIS